MAKLIVVTREGQKSICEAQAGSSVMEVIRGNGVDELEAACGGGCSCATCHVYVDPAYASLLAELKDDENELLEASGYRKETSRLSCQIAMTDALDGMTVTIAPAD